MSGFRNSDGSVTPNWVGYCQAGSRVLPWGGARAKPGTLSLVFYEGTRLVSFETHDDQRDKGWPSKKRTILGVSGGVLGFTFLNIFHRIEADLGCWVHLIRDAVLSRRIRVILNSGILRGFVDPPAQLLAGGGPTLCFVTRRAVAALAEAFNPTVTVRVHQPLLVQHYESGRGEVALGEGYVGMPVSRLRRPLLRVLSEGLSFCLSPQELDVIADELSDHLPAGLLLFEDSKVEEWLRTRRLYLYSAIHSRLGRNELMFSDAHLLCASNAKLIRIPSYLSALLGDGKEGMTTSGFISTRLQLLGLDVQWHTMYGEVSLENIKAGAEGGVELARLAMNMEVTENFLAYTQDMALVLLTSPWADSRLSTLLITLGVDATCSGIVQVCAPSRERDTGRLAAMVDVEMKGNLLSVPPIRAAVTAGNSPAVILVLAASVICVTGARSGNLSVYVIMAVICSNLDDASMSVAPALLRSKYGNLASITLYDDKVTRRSLAALNAAIPALGEKFGAAAGIAGLVVTAITILAVGAATLNKLLLYVDLSNGAWVPMADMLDNTHLLGNRCTDGTTTGLCWIRGSNKVEDTSGALGHSPGVSTPLVGPWMPCGSAIVGSEKNSKN